MIELLTDWLYTDWPADHIRTDRRSHESTGWWMDEGLNELMSLIDGWQLKNSFSRYTVNLLSSGLLFFIKRYSFANVWMNQLSKIFQIRLKFQGQTCWKRLLISGPFQLAYTGTVGRRGWNVYTGAERNRPDHNRPLPLCTPTTQVILPVNLNEIAFIYSQLIKFHLLTNQLIYSFRQRNPTVAQVRDHHRVQTVTEKPLHGDVYYCLLLWCQKFDN